MWFTERREGQHNPLSGKSPQVQSGSSETRRDLEKRRQEGSPTGAPAARAPLVRHSPLQPGAPALALMVAFVSWGWGAADTHKSLSALDPKNREEMLSGDMWSIPPKLGSLKSLGVSGELS